MQFSYVNKQQAIEVLGRVLNEILSIWAKDSAVAIVDRWILEFFPRGGVKFDAFSRNSLERSQSECGRFNGVSWCHDLITFSSHSLAKLELRVYPRQSWRRSHSCMDPGT